ncbi:hypothetical protein [Bradyrhizobium sp. B117]|uniref:hypothetical protein n=1 Tax=Bradyrhizobium sp. B117 TaxID=3140246 RepID=UPI003183227D
MTKAGTNAGNLNSLFHPAAHYASPQDVLNDPGLAAPEKRSSYRPGRPICSQSSPALRKVLGMSRAIRLADILAALRRVDGGSDRTRFGDNDDLAVNDRLTLDVEGASDDGVTLDRSCKCRPEGGLVPRMTFVGFP